MGLLKGWQYFQNNARNFDLRYVYFRYFFIYLFIFFSLILVDFSSLKTDSLKSSDEQKSIDTEIFPRQVEFLQETKHTSVQNSWDTLYFSVII